MSLARTVQGDDSRKRQRAAALQDAAALHQNPRNSARFWSAPVLWRFGNGRFTITTKSAPPFSIIGGFMQPWTETHIPVTGETTEAGQRLPPPNSRPAARAQPQIHRFPRLRSEHPLARN